MRPLSRRRSAGGEPLYLHSSLKGDVLDRQPQRLGALSAEAVPSYSWVEVAPGPRCAFGSVRTNEDRHHPSGCTAIEDLKHDARALAGEEALRSQGTVTATQGGHSGQGGHSTCGCSDIRPCLHCLLHNCTGVAKGVVRT